jgi:hypothetical protein
MTKLYGIRIRVKLENINPLIEFIDSFRKNHEGFIYEHEVTLDFISPIVRILFKDQMSKSYFFGTNSIDVTLEKEWELYLKEPEKKNTKIVISEKNIKSEIENSKGLKREAWKYFRNYYHDIGTMHRYAYLTYCETCGSWSVLETPYDDTEEKTLKDCSHCLGEK